MVQTKSSKFTENAGQNVGLEVGARMISSYRKANPDEKTSYFVGRNIIEQILAQPGCTGIKFYNAYNEAGEKVLVYVGTGENGHPILQFAAINSTGELIYKNGIVANRGIRTGIQDEDSWWDF